MLGGQAHWGAFFSSFRKRHLRCFLLYIIYIFLDKDCFMNKTEKAEILEKSKIWFKTSIMEQHQVNTRKLTSIKEFNVNPFLASYLAHFLASNASNLEILF